MNLKTRLQRLRSSRAFRRTGLFALPVIGVLLASLGVFATLPKTVSVSFAEKTCTSEFTLLPSLHRARDSSRYEVEYTGVGSLGPVDVFSTEVCFRPVLAPSPGSVGVATAPWGSVVVLQAYSLIVSSVPKLNATPLSEPIPTTRSIEVALDKPDTLHSYTMAVDKDAVTCGGGELRLICAVDELGLQQGKTYDYSITRTFSQQSQEVVAGELTTLRAVTVKTASIKKDQTVYSKPRTFTVEFDKSVSSVSARITSGGREHPVIVSVDGAKAKIVTKKDFDRETRYELIVDKVEAVDGSTLSKPFKRGFYMSGGPEVATISIGANRVASNERVVITFDQAISSKQPLESLLSEQGGAGAVVRLSDTQVAIQLAGLGRCAPFSIRVAGGVLSKYGIENPLGWTYNSRTTCAAVSVYGTSVKGRSLVAYTFGSSGPVTLYTGAIHGNEVSSKYLMDAWIDELESNPGKIGSRRIVVIPSINPDGVAAGTRNNARNVNLSRNFPTDNWVSDINDTNGPLKGGGGKEPLSEPEAKALASFTQSLDPRLLLSFHAVGGFVVGDPGGYSAGKAAQYASLAGLGNATGQVGTFDYDITGAYEDWTYRSVGIPSMVIELTSYSYAGLSQHRAALWAMLKDGV